MGRVLAAPAPALAAALMLGLVASQVIPAAHADGGTATPIQHLIVIFPENVSFDHYFGTYPSAANPPGEPRFEPAPGTPTSNGLTPDLLTGNPNLANPSRFGRSVLFTCSNVHEYGAEQRAANGGRMDRFVQEAGTRDARCDPKQVMGYYDGNTVTALWQYAQHFALSDAFYASTYGPSLPGALNLVGGQTHGAVPADVSGAAVDGTVIGNAAPAGDACDGSTSRISMSGRTVGDLLSAAGVTWGWFQGGFANCASQHVSRGGVSSYDYIATHAPFQYFASTANPGHLRPSSAAAIGLDDAAHHQYDLADFWTAAESGHLPAVSYLKPPAYQNGHAGYSTPLDEQTFLVETINRISRLPEWSSTAIVIAYDDSDGWYDHAFPPNLGTSDGPYDGLYGPGNCGARVASAYPHRCGLGPRMPLLAISPYAKQNAISHVTLEQASVLRFIEDNWRLGRLADQSFDARAASLDDLFDFARPAPAPPLLLDPDTGLPVPPPPPPPPPPTTTAPTTTTSPTTTVPTTTTSPTTTVPTTTTSPVTTAAPTTTAAPATTTTAPPATTVAGSGVSGARTTRAAVRAHVRLRSGARLVVGDARVALDAPGLRFRSTRVSSVARSGLVATLRGSGLVNGRPTAFVLVLRPAIVRIAFRGYDRTSRIAAGSVDLR